MEVTLKMKRKKDEIISVDIIIPFHVVNEHLLESILSVKFSIGVNVRVIAVNDTGVEIAPSDIGLDESDLLLMSIGNGYKDAMSTGVSSASFEYLGFQDSDDFTDKYRLFNQITFLRENKFDAVTGQLIRTNMKGQIRNWPSIFGKLPDNLSPKQKLIFGPHGADSTVIGKTPFIKNSWLAHNLFSPSFADYGWLLNIVDRAKIGFCENAYYYYRAHRNQMSRSAKDMSGWGAVHSLWLDNVESTLNLKYEIGLKNFSLLRERPFVGLCIAFPSALPKFDKIDRKLFLTVAECILRSFGGDDAIEKKFIRETIFRRGFIGTRGKVLIFWPSGVRMFIRSFTRFFSGLSPRMPK